MRGGAGNRPIQDAEVGFCFARRSFSADGTLASEFRDVDETVVRTDGAGRFEAKFETGGVVRIRARAAGFEEQVQGASVPSPPFLREVSFHLGPKDRGTSTITGRVVDLGGAPLPREDLNFLFPTVSREAETFEPIGSVSGIFALLDRDPRDDNQLRGGKIDGEKGTFEIIVSRGWRGVVALFFRDRIVGERSWQDGDPPIEFRVDPAALRERLGALEVRVVDGATGAPAPDARVRVEREDYPREYHRDMHARGFLLPRGDTLRVFYMPAGRVEVFAKAAGFAEGVAVAEIHPRETAQVVIGLQRPADARLRLVPVEGWLPETHETSAAYYDGEGRPREVTSRLEVEGEGIRVVVSGVPPGEGYLLVAGNAKKVRLQSGPGPEIEFPVRRGRWLKVRCREPRGSGAEETESASWRLSFLFDGRVPLADFRFTPTPGLDGWVERAGTQLPPGPYTLELQGGAGTIVRRGFEVGHAEETVVVVEE
ncbi:MAG: hypothetical protein L0323_02570 [Planctomycetes bacterium]|nr:hypothetical protein [Planctomycetota bacterium]